MKKPLILLLGILVSLLSYGQENDCKSIRGVVLDIETREPLPYATLTIVNTSQGAITNEHGEFLIENVCLEEVDLEVRFLGYKTLVHHHDFHHRSPTIYLAPDQLELESVIIEEDLGVHEVRSLSTTELEVSKLERLGSSSGDLVAQLSGVSTLKTGQNVVKPLIHGLHSNRVLIINNGVRHSYQAWGLEHAPEIDPSQIDRIEVVKGASTVRYGSDALGGVILFNAPGPSYRQSLGGAISGGYQTNGQGYSGEFQLREGYERVAWQVSASGAKQGDLEAPDYHLTNTGKEELGISAGIRFHWSWADLDIYANRFDQSLGILRGSVNGNLEDLANAMVSEPPPDTRGFSYDIRNPRQETTHDLVRLKSSIYVGKNQFDLQYSYQKNQRKEFDIRRGTNNDRPAIDLVLATHAIDFDWDHPSKDNWEGTLGLQFSSQNNDNLPGTNTIPFVPNFNTQSIGFFAIESLNSGNTTYEGGVRLDYLSMNVRGRDSRNNIYRDELNYTNFTFTLGVIQPLSKNWSFRTNIGSAWRPPNIGELYSFGKHQSIIEYGLWRYALDPESNDVDTGSVLTNDQKQVNSEVGFKWIGSLTYQKNGLQAEITPYTNYIRNYFFLRPFGITNTVRGSFPFFIWGQTNALYVGVDIDLKKRWNQIESEFKISYVDARDTQNGQRFLFIPPLNINGSVSFPLGKLNATLGADWTARQWNAPGVITPSEFISDNPPVINTGETFDFRPAPNGYLLLNAGVGYAFGSLNTKLEIQNLLNSSFRGYTDQISYFADDLGINVRILFAYEF